MYIFLLQMILMVNPDQELEGQTNQLIRELASSKYSIRENASNQLMEMGRPIIPIIKSTIKETEDVEVKWRLQEVLNIHFYEAYHGAIPIWFLPKRLRIKGEKDLGMMYYNEARDYCNNNKRSVSMTNWSDLYVTKLATSKFLFDLIDSGTDEIEIRKIKEEMNYLQATTEKYSSYHFNFHLNEEPDYTVPLLIEEFIKKIIESTENQALEDQMEDG